MSDAAKPTPALARRRTGRPRGTVLQWTLALVIINLLWRAGRYAMGFPIWGDEGFVVVNLYHRDFGGMIEPLEYGQIVPLLFMWGELAATRLLGLSEYALHLLPFLAGMAGMLLYWRFARRTLGRWNTLLAVGIFAASYYPVRHATEVKPYGIDLLVSLILTWLAWRVAEQPRNARRWWALILFAPLSLWLSYPAVFIAGGIGLFLTSLLWREPSKSRAGLWVLYGLGLIASFAALFVLYAGPHAAATWVPGEPNTVEQWGTGFPPIKEPAKLALWVLDVHTSNLTAYPVGGKNGGSSLTFILVLIGIAVLWRTRRTLLLLLLCPVPLALVAAALQRYPYGGSARYSQHLAPAICMLAGVGLLALLKRTFKPRRVPGAVRGAAVVLGLIALAGLARDIIEPYKTYADLENRQIARWLAAETSPNDQWVTFNTTDPALPYADYIHPRSGYGARHRYYLHRFSPVPILYAPPAESVTAPAGGRTWLIIYKDDRVPFPQDLLDAYVGTLTTDLGEPRRHLFPLHRKPNGKPATRHQTIEIFEFPVRK